MVEQLRREAAIKRVNVSQAIEDIKVIPQGPRTRRVSHRIRDLFSKNIVEIFSYLFRPPTPG